MKQSEPSQINQLQPYRPPCTKCGAPTMLARIEPTASADHDCRTFECTHCANSDTKLIKFR